LVSITWSDGCLSLKISYDLFKIKGYNFELELRPRTIILKNYSRYRVGTDQRRKYVYVYFDEKIKPLDKCDQFLEIKGVRYIDSYEFRYTRTFYDEYYTIVVPGIFYIEYIILSSTKLGIVLSKKREVYFEETSEYLIIYIV